MAPADAHLEILLDFPLQFCDGNRGLGFDPFTQAISKRRG
jgi:hypothetical protein